MRKSYQIFFGILILALFLEVLIGFPIHLESTPEPKETAQKDLSNFSGAQQKMEGVHLVESSKGARDWELFAEVAEGYEGKGIWELKVVKVLFYNGDAVDFTVMGKTGRIDTKTKDMKIEGDVKTSSVNGYQFNSPSVEYLAGKRVLISPDKVRMVGPSDSKGKGLSVQGNGMETDVEQNIMKIKENVVANKSLLDGKNFVIRSKSAEFSGKSKSAKFVDHVSIEIDSLKMEGPEALFEYSSGSDFLSSILLKGGVRVSDFDKYATADQVKFDPSENKFVFNGRPRVVQNNDEITGDQIVFIDGGKRVKVENIKARVDNK